MLPPVQTHYHKVLGNNPDMRRFHNLFLQAHERFSNEELAKGAVSGFLDEIKRNSDTTTSTMFHLMMLYERFGLNTYVVGPKMQELFRRTNLAKVPKESIKMPHSTFYIDLPNSMFQIWGGHRTKMHNVCGMYVSLGQRIYTGEECKGISSTDLDAREDCVYILICAHPNKLSLTKDDDAVYWYGIGLEKCYQDGGDFESYLEERSKMVRKGMTTVDGVFGLKVQEGELSDEVVKNQQTTLIEMFRIAVNTILYVGSKNVDSKTLKLDVEKSRLRRKLAGLKSKKKRYRAQKEIDQIPGGVATFLGCSFEDNPLITLKAMRSPSGPHRVPHHWQNYWVGSKPNQRRVLKLVGPYMRGLEKVAVPA